jgi:hypothetical protein
MTIAKSSYKSIRRSIPFENVTKLSQLKTIIRRIHSIPTNIHLSYEGLGGNIPLYTDDDLLQLLLENKSYIRFTVDENVVSDTSDFDSSFSWDAQDAGDVSPHTLTAVRSTGPESSSLVTHQEKIEGVNAHNHDIGSTEIESSSLVTHQERIEGVNAHNQDIGSTELESSSLVMVDWIHQEMIESALIDIHFEFEKWKSHKSTELYWKVKSLKIELEKMKDSNIWNGQTDASLAQIMSDCVV